ncbi:hypothetical protein EV385_5367 [Krasilnikovia cinnamomea]|uniref:Uncharacterized protein n=1 Tax=Krasilnikovia cinnamomea TaxID=349313 RepID=A0A4Q7ZQP8_9ACTN|nr:hypothetical protein [Krasilnikovia cinnamomea]RZU53440.1 hypothetical protein EV385_5367 [Krasilnikovia cinnamomea]
MTGFADLRSAVRGRRALSLITALLAAVTLLVSPAGPGRSSPTATAGQAWPAARRGTVPPALPDGTAYQPALFLSAAESVGTAPTRDGKALRLVLRGAGAQVREVRRLPLARGAVFSAVTVAGDILVWVQSVSGRQEVWAVGLRDGRPPRRLTTEVGDARFYQSQYDLAVADGRVYWVAAAPRGEVTEVRSVALGGGRTEVRDVPGAWALSAWPWLVNGVVSASGATALRDVVTGRERAVPSGTGVVACSPVWCRVVSLTRDGTTRIELMHPDGTGRAAVADGEVATVITDVAVLDRFEVFSRLTPASRLTGNVQLLVYDIAVRRTVEISPDAFGVSYRAGVLSWSTGNQQSFLRHALDLRSV